MRELGRREFKHTDGFLEPPCPSASSDSIQPAAGQRLPTLPRLHPSSGKQEGEGEGGCFLPPDFWVPAATWK